MICWMSMIPKGKFSTHLTDIDGHILLFVGPVAQSQPQLLLAVDSTQLHLLHGREKKTNKHISAEWTGSWVVTGHPYYDHHYIYDWCDHNNSWAQGHTPTVHKVSTNEASSIRGETSPRSSSKSCCLCSRLSWIVEHLTWIFINKSKDGACVGV